MPYIANTPTINANIFFTFEDNFNGYVGYSTFDSVCSTNTSNRASVMDYYYTDSQTARVII